MLNYLPRALWNTVLDFVALAQEWLTEDEHAIQTRKYNQGIRPWPSPIELDHAPFAAWMAANLVRADYLMQVRRVGDSPAYRDSYPSYQRARRWWRLIAEETDVLFWLTCRGLSLHQVLTALDGGSFPL